MKPRLFSLIFLLLLSLQSYSQDTVNDFDYGTIKDGLYTNNFFGLTMTIPTDWVIQNKEEVDRIMKTGKELASGDDASMKAIIKASEVNIANLLVVYQYELGSPVDFNPNISVTVENVQQVPGVKNGSDYLFLARRFMEQAQIKYESIDKKFEKKMINGTEFYKMNAKINYMGLNIQQSYYSTVLKGFSIIVIDSYINKAQEKDLLQIVNSIHIKN